MNLNEYDVPRTSIDKNKTYTDIQRYRIVSKEITYRRYYTIAEKVNIKQNKVDYFLILLNYKPLDRNYYITDVDDFGRLKFKLHSIWKNSILHNLKKNCNINISHIEHDDDCDIYELDV